MATREITDEEEGFYQAAVAVARDMPGTVAVRWHEDAKGRHGIDFVAGYNILAHVAEVEGLSYLAEFNAAMSEAARLAADSGRSLTPADITAVRAMLGQEDIALQCSSQEELLRAIEEDEAEAQQKKNHAFIAAALQGALRVGGGVYPVFFFDESGEAITRVELQFRGVPMLACKRQEELDYMYDFMVDTLKFQEEGLDKPTAFEKIRELARERGFKFVDTIPHVE